MTCWQMTQLCLAAAFALILAAVASLSLDGDDLRSPFRETPLPELCETRRETGELCPSCGLTRGMVASIHGDWDLARRWHRSSTTLLALLLGQVVVRLALATRPLRGPRTLVIGALDFLAHAFTVRFLLGIA